MIPERLKGVELEKEILHVVKKSDEVTGNKYGVLSSYQNDTYRPVKSYPDLEGVFGPYGRQWITECKVCSQASLHLAARIKDDKQSKQLAHMLRRAEFGAVTFYTVHFNYRHLKTKTSPACTFAFPVHPCHPYWLRFLGGFESKVNIEICEEYAIELNWHIPPRGRKPRIDFVPAITKIDALLECHRSKDSTTWHESPIFSIVG